MIFRFKRLFLVAAIFSATSQVGADPETDRSYQINGDVPEGWEVVAVENVAPVKKWVTLKSGEKKKVFVRPFALKPVADQDAKFTVKNPLETSSGQDLSAVVEAQNENLVQSQAELSSMLTRLRQLLRTLPVQSESE